MFDKRLMVMCPESKKYIVGNNLASRTAKRVMREQIYKKILRLGNNFEHGCKI